VIAVAKPTIARPELVLERLNLRVLVRDFGPEHLDLLRQPRAGGPGRRRLRRHIRDCKWISATALAARAASSGSRETNSICTTRDPGRAITVSRDRKRSTAREFASTLSNSGLVARPSLSIALFARLTVATASAWLWTAASSIGAGPTRGTVSALVK